MPQTVEFLLDEVENIVGKGENATPQCYTCVKDTEDLEGTRESGTPFTMIFRFLMILPDKAFGNSVIKDEMFVRNISSFPRIFQIIFLLWSEE